MQRLRKHIRMLTIVIFIFIQIFFSPYLLESRWGYSNRKLEGTTGDQKKKHITLPEEVMK